MPRIALVDSNGTIAYLGYPSKIDLHQAITNLLNKEPLDLEPEILKQDEPEHDSISEHAMKCPYTPSLDLRQIKDEMARFEAELFALSERDPSFKAQVASLSTDSVL